MSIPRGLRASFIAVALWGMSGAGCRAFFGESEPPVIEVEVVRGDTLFQIARAHGVTVEELRTWNDIEGDLIEVGQILVIRGGGAPAPLPAAPRPRAPSAPGPAPAPAQAGLAMPPEQPCLPPPSAEGLGEEGMVGSVGLSVAQIRAAMDPFLPNTLGCLSDPSTQGQIELQITVACSGRVQRVQVQRTTLGPEITACVADRLRFVGFPAHDLPDGETFAYPLTFGG